MAFLVRYPTVLIPFVPSLRSAPSLPYSLPDFLQRQAAQVQPRRMVRTPTVPPTTARVTKPRA